MYASHVVSICHSDIFVLVFLLKILVCIVAYSYIYTQLAYRRGLPKQADGGGDRATNLQNLSTLEQTSRQPTIWIRQTVEATYQLWGNRTSGSDRGGNLSTLEQTSRQPKIWIRRWRQRINFGADMEATEKSGSDRGGNLVVFAPLAFLFLARRSSLCQIQPTGHS